MNNIDSIIIHCSATKAGQDFKAKDIDRMHRARGFSQIGYHFVVDLDLSLIHISETVPLKKVDLSKSREHTATQKDHPVYHTINTALEFVISEVLI